MKFLLTLFAFCLLSLAGAFQLGSQQLVLLVGDKQAYLNGESIRLDAPVRVHGGRTLLPLRAVAYRLGLPLTSPEEGVLRLGDLLLKVKETTGTFRGNPIEPQSFVLLDNVLYLHIRLFADAAGASLAFSEEGKTLTLTTSLARDLNVSLPQARFLTAKTTYAMGEKINYLDYSFDPEGAPIVSRKWSNRQDAFFTPGPQVVSLQVLNDRGKWSTVYSRTLTISDQQVDQPLNFALKVQPLGSTVQDDAILSYPIVPLYPVASEERSLMFSDSPESVATSGILYRDDLQGKTRILGYHMNVSDRPARLFIQVRNLGISAGQAVIERFGETAPTRVVTTLGQGTLLDFYASAGTRTLRLPAGENLALYSSPVLPPQTGVNVMMDVEFSHRTQVTLFMLMEGDDPQTLQVLRPDGKHHRGTFLGAVRELKAQFTTLPARLVIGDEKVDQPLVGIDATTLNTVVLKGNYGLLYRITVTGLPDHAVGALSPRGGIYKGALHVDDLPIPLPETGVLTRSNNPIIFSKGTVNRLEFIPANGSSLPINLVFYPTQTPAPAQAHKAP